MKKYTKFFSGLLTIIALVSLSTGCDNDIYDEHYNKVDASLNMNINELIASDSELTAFEDLLVASGYSTIINNSQSYTVWAPTNDALASLPSTIKDDSEALKDFVGNHISLFSFTSGDAAKEKLLVKMLNGKYVQFENEGTATFAGVSLMGEDILTNNGILHKLTSYVEVKSNIWGYLNDNSTQFPVLMNYLEPFNTILFDESASTSIGKNSLGATVYDSVFVASNSYFDIVGNLNSEEQRHSFVGLTDDVYNMAYDTIKAYYNHPDSTVVATNVNKAIFENLNFPEIESYTGMAVNTMGKEVSLPMSAIQEDIPLSNGNVMVLNKFTFTPEELFNSSVRYELENSERRTIGDYTSFSIKKLYDITASDEFTNKLSLLFDPIVGVNDFVEVAFNEVLSTEYDIFVKFSPVGDLLDTRLRFDLSYTKDDKTLVTTSIDTLLVSSLENERIQIGKTFSNPVYVNSDKKNDYTTKLSITIDVSNAETVIYDRIVGIDYIELVPVK